MKNKKQKGYTLVEILVTVTIITVMAYFAVPVYNKIVQQSDVSDALHNIDMFSNAQEKYYIQNGKYTGNLGQLETPLKGEKATVETTKFSYSAGDPREDDYCIYSKSRTKNYVLARNYKINSEILCNGDDCGKVESFVKKGDFKEMCSKSSNNTPNQNCNNTESYCKSINPKWGLRKDCSCGCTVEEKICSKSQRWSAEECACVLWNSCDLTEEKCKSLYTPNHFLYMDGSGSCECKCRFTTAICNENNADSFDEKTCSCVCVNDDVKKCAEQNKVLTGDCQCICAEIKKCNKGYVFSHEKCECIKTDCGITEEECKEKNKNWTLLEDCSCGCEQSLVVKRCPDGYSYSQEKCACVMDECTKTDEECQKYYGKYFILNKEKCSCECGITEDKCKSEVGILNKEKCVCEPISCTKTDEECKKENENWALLDGCTCGCPKVEKCNSKLEFWNSETCKCEFGTQLCNLTLKECQGINENYILDTDSCNCKCGLTEKECTSQGLQYNVAKCKCEGELCDLTENECQGKNKYWTLLKDCTCGCETVELCDSGLKWDENLCKCVSSVIKQ